MLLAMQPTAKEQRRSDHAAKDNHDDGEQRVAHEGRIIGAVQHHGGDAHHLDGSHRQRQNECAVGLAEDFGNVVGVPDNREGGTQHNSEQPNKYEREP